MSYYKLKRCTIDKKKEQIRLCVADSSIRPLYYFNTEYMAKENVPFKDKLTTFFVDCIDGNFHFNASCKNYGAVDTIERTISCCDLLSIVEDDWKFKVNFRKEMLTEVVSVFVDEFFFNNTKNLDVVREKACEWADKLPFMYADLARKMRKEDKLPIASAVGIDENKVLLYTYAGNEVIADKSDYTALGILDNASRYTDETINVSSLFS